MWWKMLWSRDPEEIRDHKGKEETDKNGLDLEKSKENEAMGLMGDAFLSL